MTNQKNKQIAIDFLNTVMARKIDEAYKKYVDIDGKHHNPHSPTGFRALKDAMKDAHNQFPDAQITIKNVIGDDDLVSVHSHVIMKPKEIEMIAFHLFRIKNEKIVEFWDCAQMIKPDSQNKDGEF